MSRLKLGTRGSQLALYQARAVAALLLERADVTCDVVVIKTSGDQLAEAPLSEIGGKRLFVKEIEEALAAGDIDLAVHSSKDMPVVLPDGLEIGAVLAREDPRDAIVLPGAPGGAPPDAMSLEEIARVLGREPRIGTSSVRRSAQLARLFPGARFEPIRGNLDTRLRKLDEGRHDALVLAAAGLRRLDRGDRISSALPVDACVPAPGQGIIAVELRADDTVVKTHVARLDEPFASVALRAERAVVARLGGGCQMPIGAYADVTADLLSLTAIVISPDGAQVARAAVTGAPGDADTLGREAALQLLERGADTILADVQRAQAAVDGLQP
jgi:hydroxymethylbilane synthase